MPTPKIYKKCDIELKKLKENLKREINRLSVLPIDELNIVGLKEETTKLMKKQIETCKKAYLRIGDSAQQECLAMIVASGYGAKSTLIDTKWVESVLKAYNIQTGYLFYPEADRKRMRLVEEILTAHEFKSVEAYEEAIKKFGNLWWTQIMAYGNQMVDAIMMQNLTDAGVEWVRWEAEEDDRTCHTCEDLDGIVFRLKDLPDKPHRNCRCWYTPMPKGYKG